MLAILPNIFSVKFPCFSTNSFVTSTNIKAASGFFGVKSLTFVELIDLLFKYSTVSLSAFWNNLTGIKEP